MAVTRRRLTDRDRELRAVPEAAFTTQVVRLARTYGWLVHHSRPARALHGRWSTPIEGSPGLPDLVMVRPRLPSRLIFAELKREAGGVTSEWQVAWLNALDDVAGVEVYVWRPSQYDEIAEVLAK